MAYPPSDTTMTRRCTQVLCGAPNRTLYDLVNQELLNYLNQPGLTAEKLFEDFGDTKGSFYNYGSLDLTGSSDGEWLSWKYAPGWRNMEAATALANSSPGSARDIMSIPKIGPDHYYDMFRRTLLRMIEARGVCLLVFRWIDGRSLMRPKFFNGEYFIMTKMPSGEKYYVKTKNGIPYALDDDSAFFALPTTGTYMVQMAIPKYDYYNPDLIYQASDLKASSVCSTTVDITPNTKCLRIDVETSRLEMFFSHKFGFKAKEWKFDLVRQQSDYSAYKGSPLYNKNGRLCNGNTPCKKFSSRRQKDIELSAFLKVTKPAGRSSLTLYNIPDGTHKVLVYSDDGIVVATVIGIEFKFISRARTFNSFTLPHFASGVIDPLPKKAFLQGDIIRQYQQETSNCGTFSLALAASYWNPFTYNPMQRNGKWMEDEHGDWPSWTGQGTMEDVAAELGFNNRSNTLDEDDTSRAKGIAILKKQIARGVPVIVNIDEYQDTYTFKGEHYKVLVGYDDDRVLHYTKPDGSIGSVKGALYFANSGAKGLDEGNPNKFVDGIANTRRENHADYDNVPIGNDVDSYKAFWYKWKHGGYWPVTSDLWYLPFYPTTD